MDASPFPPLEAGEYAWEGQDVLPAWAGLQDRGGSYGAPGGASLSDGTVELVVSPPGGEQGRPPLPEQAAAYARLKADGEAVRDAALAAILDYARGLDPAYDLPDDLDRAAICGMVGLSVVHVLDVAKDGLAYVGLELGCDWDEEHGCGVMTHAGRVVEAGPADVSFLEWIAEKDGGTSLG